MQDKIVRIDRVNAYVKWLEKQDHSKPITKGFAFDTLFGGSNPCRARQGSRHHVHSAAGRSAQGIEVLMDGGGAK